MREIKFRAWDKERKEMLSPERLCHFDGELSKGVQERSPFFDLMQFTGLHDKNGKEIWEGDIVRRKLMDGIDNIYEVFWDQSVCSFSVRPTIPYGTTPVHHEMAKKLEVIGDIHNNPELLTGK